WLWVDADEVPVSLATRRRPISGSARIGPVYTPPSQRGRGYGSAVTAAATREVLDLGAIPVLFTDLANPVSNSIYQRLGYRPVDDYAMITLR
ncbi:MAG: GNAT family N-acetyltransferase, partial [Chloroflexi bacterium]|nr:GNAT family N-acetyltransferase [Chloroflexota bacterium]